MSEFKIVNSDQGHKYVHYVEALDRDTAIKNFRAGHYGEVVKCEEVKEPIVCPHCGKEIEI